MTAAAQPSVMPDRVPMAPGAVETLAAIAAREAGFVIDRAKPDFLVSRLSRRIAALDLPDGDAYAALLASAAGRPEIPAFLEALATHTTSFFREAAHYRWLETEGLRHIAGSAAADARPAVIWSAACSSGPELYSAMMLAAEGPEGGPITGIGTDLSARMVRRARDAVFHEHEIEGIPPPMRRRHLLVSRSGDGRCRIAPPIRACTSWRVANLTRASDLQGIEADMIFLRNVLIYFGPDSRARVLSNVLSRLRPGGFLVCGHAETGAIAEEGLIPIHPSIYRKARP